MTEDPINTLIRTAKSFFLRNRNFFNATRQKGKLSFFLYGVLRHFLFSIWIKDMLPTGELGFWVSDIDFVFYNREKNKLMLLEIKHGDNNLRDFQVELFSKLDLMLREGAKNIGCDYLGYHILRFENSFWDSGKVYLDEKEITEEEFKKLIWNVF